MVDVLCCRTVYTNIEKYCLLNYLYDKPQEPYSRKLEDMVLIIRNLFAAERKVARQHIRGSFIDSLRLHVKGGSGGNGLPRYGGVGGQGGCVYLVANDAESLRIVSQRWPQRRVIAKHGSDSSRQSILGTRGADEKIEVPVGVTVLDEYGRIIGDLNTPGSSCVAAGGGRGGGPNNAFLGAKGQSRTVTLDLKLIANVGLVGLPNAGKSTLLKAISKAKPKIASYPFTTIRPNIGVIEYPDFRQISIADLPGLIEGAHANIGMGHKFLKHVERTSLLLLVCDISGFQLSPQHRHRTCLDTVFILNRELELYRPDLLDKPALLLINKMDTHGAKDQYNKIRDKLENLSDVIEECPEEIRPARTVQFDRILPISAKESKQDIMFVRNAVREVLDFHAELAMRDPHPKVLAELRDKHTERGPKLT